MSGIKIVSGGHADTTRVLLPDGRELPGVVSVTIDIVACKPARATLVIEGHMDLDLEGVEGLAFLRGEGWTGKEKPE